VFFAQAPTHALDMDPTLHACVQRSLAGPQLAPAAELVAPPPLTMSAFGMRA